MADEVEKLLVRRVSGERKDEIEDIVAKEFPLTIILNDQELVTLFCSPMNLKSLAVGFLFSEGLIGSKDEIREIMLEEQKGIVRVETKEEKDLAPKSLFKRFIASGGGKGTYLYSAADTQATMKVRSEIKISSQEIFALVKEFQHRSQVYKTTGGTHSAALGDKNHLLIFAEDIGRHNAIDKIFGECLLRDISTDNKLVITSGRISSEILLKVAKRNIPIIISKSAPTNLGVRLAKELNITLIGFARGRRMNIYSEGWRVES